MFLKNAWYVAAWSEDIKDDLQHYEVLYSCHAIIRAVFTPAGTGDKDVKHAFEEDRAILNEVQKGMSGKTSPHIDLPIDGGQLRFRRQLEIMIDQERTADKALA